MRENNFVESRKALIENRERRESEKEKLIKEYHDKRESFMNNYHSIRESREQKLRLHGKLMEACRNEALATAIKAIYITALEAGTLTDDGIILAENMVDKWVEERGGASKILSECSNKTYLLARIAQIVEEAAIHETEEIENADKEVKDAEFEELPSEENKAEESGDTEVDLAVKVIQNNIDTEDEEVKKALDIIKQKAEEKSAEEESPEETPSEESKEDETPVENDKDSEEAAPAEGEVEEQPKEDSGSATEETPASDESGEETKNNLNVDFDDFEDDTEDEESEEEKSDESESSEEVEVPDDATDKSDDNESDVAEDIIDDLEEVPEEDLSIDGEEENSGKVFNELEKEKDVKKAIELIRQRVADAEETFIKRNAEDKKQIDELIGKISDNVKTIENLDDENSTESKIAQESVRLTRQKMKSITENRPLSIMEKMTRNLHANILKDEVVKEHYMMENGNLDTALIVEAGKVMYGFLETLNTLQLEKVDAKYIEKVLNEM